VRPSTAVYRSVREVATHPRSGGAISSSPFRLGCRWGDRQRVDTALLEAGEEFFHLPVGAQPTLNQLPAPEDDEVADLLAIVRSPGALNEMVQGEVRDGTFLFYAVICIDLEGDPVAFIKQQQGIRVARSARVALGRLRHAALGIGCWSGMAWLMSGRRRREDCRRWECASMELWQTDIGHPHSRTG
jgi:hypothetical protein